MNIAEVRQKLMHWQEKRRDDQLIKFDHVHERSISILQKRYGYSREKATSELIKHYSKAWLG
jgi:hypothetical protein